MARMNEFEPLYEAFQLFIDRCIIHDQSLLWPDQNIWTLNNLNQWKELVIESPDPSGNLSFTEKLEIQLSSAQPILWGMAADLHFVYYLPSDNITMQTKLKNIRWAAEKSNLKLPNESDPIWEAQQHGFTRTTMKYHFRYAQLQLLVYFAIYLKKQNDIEQILEDHLKVKKILDDILENISAPIDRAHDIRHAILYLLFPDHYERMISKSHKEMVLDRYKKYVSDPEADLDEKLYQVRRGLSKTMPEKPNYDYYRDLKQEWNPDDHTGKPPGIIGEDKAIYNGDESDIVIEASRLIKRFKNVILFGPPGTGKTYWANRIAKHLVKPQLQQGQSRGAFLQKIIENLTFYEIIALEMYLSERNQKFSVPQLVKSELIQARFKLNPVKFPTNQIWGYLQAHTDPECEFVKFASRSEPYLFEKDQNAKWSLIDEGFEHIQNTLQEKVKMIRQGPPPENNPEDFINWVTFHQSYAYEDFVEGLRPNTDQSDTVVLSFEIKQGIFRNICALAMDDPNNQYILVIDEINRGNIAKIFGELMTLIEADKRSTQSVELPYSKEHFTVPGNLYIIGTMNTADRSIALLDVALRRRFAFMEILPDPSLLDEVKISLEEEDTLNIGACLRKINQRIVEYRGGDYQIGHSYFMPLSQIPNETEKLTSFGDIWNYQVIPLLKEYFYGQPDLLHQVLPSFYLEDMENGDQNSSSPAILTGEDLVAALNNL